MMAEATPSADESGLWKQLPLTVQDAGDLRQEAMDAHHDHLITEIETSEGPLATTLRAVYDGDDVNEFHKKLEDRIESHDRDIERMCNYHYQGFIDSVRELQQVGGDAAGLKRDIKNLDGHLQQSCKPLLDIGEKLIKSRRVQKNITQAIEKLSLCLPVLEMYGKLQEQMNSKRFYPALKTLEQLEHTYLPRVMNHWFSQTMAEAIPKLRQQIKEASMSELKDFLENIRKHSTKIGEVAMKHAAEQNNIDPSIAKKKMKKRRAPPPPNPFTGEVEHPPPPVNLDDDEEEDELSAQDLVDFSPVYRCLHIYTVLGDRDKFETYYRQQRWKQARLSLQPPQNMHESIEAFRKYFHDVVGFFVVEDHILHTTQGLVTRSYMDELWEKAVEKMSSTLRTSALYILGVTKTCCFIGAACEDKQTEYSHALPEALEEELGLDDHEEQSCKLAALMLEIKKLIVLFCHTLKGYGFIVGRLLELLLEMRDRYSDILSEQWVEVFNEIFAEDNYTPICCETQEDYSVLVSRFPYQDKELQETPFPRRFPFSQFVPSIFSQVKEYINACLKFSADLHLSHTEIDDMIRKSANQLLTKTLGGCLSALIKRPNLSLLQLIQISINMNYMERSCPYLEAYISTITGAEKDSVHVARLHGTSMFKDARNDAEQHIYQQLNAKIDEFLDLATYDWTLMESRGHASSYIMDLMAFLQSIFMSFTNLPLKMVYGGLYKPFGHTTPFSNFQSERKRSRGKFHKVPRLCIGPTRHWGFEEVKREKDKVAKTACMSACQHISSRLMGFLLDNDIRQLTMGALQQFNLDIMQCEQFAESEPVPGSNDGTLQMAFCDLRQLMDLFINWDWSVYLADFGKQQARYLRVQRHTAINLLEKLNNADKKKNNLFTSLKKIERDKKKLVDTVLKQLRGLENGTTPQG